MKNTNGWASTKGIDSQVNFGARVNDQMRQTCLYSEIKPKIAPRNRRSGVKGVKGGNKVVRKGGSKGKEKKLPKIELERVDIRISTEEA